MKATEEKISSEAKEIKKSVNDNKKKSFIKKLTAETCKILQALSEKANRKSHGRKIRDNDLIALGLSLIEAKHIEILQDQSLSEKDRLSLAHEEYQKAHGKITLDHFIGKLLRGEVLPISQKSN